MPKGLLLHNSRVLKEIWLTKFKAEDCLQGVASSSRHI
jgi:hypothetical protein